jgi:hypothetical protein
MWMRLLPFASPDTVYRIIVSLATCLGPVTLFLFALHFMGSRRWAFAAATAYSFLSPRMRCFRRWKQIEVLCNCRGACR